MRSACFLLWVFCAPTVLAWTSGGDSEPSTIYDGPSLMWPSAPTGDGGVYFNVAAVVGAGGTGFVVNPNVAALETRNEPVGAETFVATLGVWADCNGDGYVGNLEGAAREYASELLFRTDICPPSSGSESSWNGEHNYNGWVTELIPIGNAETTPVDLRLYLDASAAVWGDYGRPAPREETCGGGAGDSLLRILDCMAESSEATLGGSGLDVIVSGIPRIEPDGAKRSADWNFHFLTGNRGGFPSSAIRRGRSGADDHLGLLEQGSRWMADAVAAKATPRTVRGSLDEPIDEGRWVTFYARVGHQIDDRGLQLPGGSGTYGAEACGAAEDGIRAGWQCDASLWNRDATGMPSPTSGRTLARPGMTYRLRDVDCHDGGTSMDIGIGAPFYGERPCAAG